MSDEGERPPAPEGSKATLEADAKKAVTDTILLDRLEEAALMLAHAAETGQELKPEVVSTIANAREALARGAWTIDLTKQFWPAYGQLCSAIKPVTGESLLASSSKGLARTLARYRTGTFWLALVILPLSVVMFMNTSISNEISQQVKDNDALAVTLRDQLLAIPQSATGQDQPTPALAAQPITGHPRNEKDIITALQQFATATRFLYGRAVLLNRFVFQVEREDPFLQKSAEQKRSALELPARLDDIPAAGFDKIVTYQDIRAFAKTVQEMNLMVYGAITAYFLPVLYALLGACAYALRSLSQQTLARTYTPSYADFARIIIAVIAGLVVGLFNNFTQGISLSPLAVAFLVGYAVEIFFSFLDAFLDTLKKVRS
jgi:hypothetical protein